jgi:dipeptidyl aminopeptidase/acylaminoacyl peptidase
MRLARLAAAFAGLALCAQPAFAEITAHPIAAEDFARIANISSVSLSPDGHMLVAIIAKPGSNNEDSALATWDLDNLSAGPVVTPSGDKMKFIAAAALKAGGVWVLGRQEWTGRLGGCGEGRETGASRTFVTKPFITDQRQTEFNPAFATGGLTVGVNQDTERCFEIAGTTSLAAMLPLDPENVIVQRVNLETLRGDYYRYNLRTHLAQVVFREAGASVSFINPRDGEILVRQRQQAIGDDYDVSIEIRNPQTGDFEVQPALTHRLADRYTLDFLGIDEATGQFYVSTDKFSDKAEIYMYDPRAGAFSAQPALAHPQYSVVGIVLGEHPSDFNKLLGFVYSGPERTTFWVDPQMRAIQDGLDAIYPGLHVSILDFNDDRSRVLYETSSGANPPTYYLLRNRHEAVLIGASRPWLDTANMRKPDFITYAARDGMQITGVLTLPAGWSKADGPLPAIVLPHGGPWARDYVDWDASGWPQFLASRGYAVLQPNYRGSEELGRRLWLAGDAQWGLAMSDDNDDAAAWLVSQGVAAPDRIAIFGYSYGGFAAIAATVRPHSPYQCAVAGAGVSALTRLGNSWSEDRQQRIYQGRTVAGMDPSHHVDDANIPILLFYGDRDVRVPTFHSQEFYNAVRSKVPAELVVIPDMPHSLPWYPRHFRTMLGALENYLKNDCGPGGL